MELRLDGDTETEEKLDHVVARWELEVVAPLAEALKLFSQPAVLDMAKERPKLVASVNHYKAKLKDLEKEVEDARRDEEKAKDKDKPKKAVATEAATKKLESNQQKHDAENEKLTHVTKQLIAMFNS